MKIIEALKKIKDLARKQDDIKSKIAEYCCDLDIETPTYPDQKRQISDWLQAHGDILKEMLHLKFSIQRTNTLTPVTITIDDRPVTKKISEWIFRRKELAKVQESAWRVLTTKNYPEAGYKNKPTPNSPETIVKRRLYFDPVERDKKIELYRSEPHIIDSTLEVINATTELIES
jgi:hypothetical protein